MNGGGSAPEAIVVSDELFFESESVTAIEQDRVGGLAASGSQAPR
jgi:hypothetical protein